MTTHRRRTNAIAVLLAVIAAVFAAAYARSGSSKAAVPSSRHVLVATRDIPAGTPGSLLLSQHLVSTRAVASGSVVADAIGDKGQLGGVIATQQIRAGQQLNLQQFAAGSGDESPAAALRGNERVITVAGAPDQLLAGIVQAGDHVDVVASIAYPQGSSSHYSRIVLRNLLVLRAPGKTGSAGMAGPAHDVTATLALDDSQAQALFYVLKNADWSLLLRPVTLAGNGETKNFTAANLLGWSR
jgi:Flp pilus assembly protein CpaB